MKVNIIEHL